MSKRKSQAKKSALNSVATTDEAAASDDEEQTSGQAIWTTAQTVTLLSALQDRVHLRSGNGWKGQVWNEVASAVNDEHPDAQGGPKTGTKCQHKFGKLKTATQEIEAILKVSSGFGWDTDKNTITAGDSVWGDAVKANSKRRYWRGKSFAHLDEMRQLIGNSVATGEGALLLLKQGSTADDDQATYQATPTSAKASSKATTPAESDAESSVEPHSFASRKRKASTTSSPAEPSRKKDRRISSSQGMVQIADALGSIARSVAPPATTGSTSVEIAVGVINDHAELTDEEKLVAMDLLCAADSGSRFALTLNAITNTTLQTAWIKRQVVSHNVA